MWTTADHSASAEAMATHPPLAGRLAEQGLDEQRGRVPAGRSVPGGLSGRSAQRDASSSVDAATVVVGPAVRGFEKFEWSWHGSCDSAERSRPAARDLRAQPAGTTRSAMEPAQSCER